MSARPLRTIMFCLNSYRFRGYQHRRVRLSLCEPPVFQKGAAMAPQSPPAPAVALNLALAVVASSFAPLLLLDKDLMVVAASTSFCRVFQIAPVKAQGCQLAELGDGEWLV